MNTNELRQFEGRFVKLVLHDGSVYFGRLQTSGDTITLNSTRGNSIHFQMDQIQSVT